MCFIPVTQWVNSSQDFNLDSPVRTLTTKPFLPFKIDNSSNIYQALPTWLSSQLLIWIDSLTLPMTLLRQILSVLTTTHLLALRPWLCWIGSMSYPSQQSQRFPHPEVPQQIDSFWMNEWMNKPADLVSFFWLRIQTSRVYSAQE